MSGWVPRILARIRELATQRKVWLTYKARHELAALDLGLDLLDVCDVLARLTWEDVAGRLASKNTGEWMYTFKPSIAGNVIYLKVILRAYCVVVSFHEEDSDDEDEGKAKE